MNQYICSHTNHSLFSLNDVGEYTFLEQVENANQVLLAGNECQILSAHIPVKQAKQIIKALPFALEEQLANDIESNHIEFLGRNDGLAFALVLDHKKIQTLIEKYNPDSIQYLPLLLPYENNKITICILNGIANIRANEFSAFTVNADLTSRLVQDFKNEDFEVIDFYDIDEKHDLIALELESAGFQINKPDKALLISTIKENANKNKWNLLTGPYTKKKVPVKTKHSKLKPLMYLAASLLAISFATNIIQLKQYQQMTELVENASQSFYEQLFPGEKARVLKRQFKDKLSHAGAGSTGNTGFVNLLGGSSKLINQIADVEWDAIRFNKNKNELELNLIVDNIAQLDSIKGKLAEQGMMVDIASANNTGKRIKGVLKVRKNG